MTSRRSNRTKSKDTVTIPRIKHKRRYNQFSLQTQCRICLTQCLNTNLSLDAFLNPTHKSEISVVEALELVTNEKVHRGPNYPDTVCGMCLGYLKIAHELIEQYKESKKTFLKQLKESGEEVVSDNENYEPKKQSPILQPIPKNSPKKETKAPVEILIGTDKFDIKDLFIVEEEDDEDDSFSYDGFLQNLGTTVSASFVEKGYQIPKPVLEAPSFVIEKIGQKEIPSEIPLENPEDTEIEEIPSEIPLENPEDTEIGNDDYDMPENQAEDLISGLSDALIDKLGETLEPVCTIETDETVFLNKPNTDIIDNVTLLNEYEKSAVQSALKLKYKCPYCLKPMSTLNRAKSHSRKCSKNTDSVQCYVCDISFKNRKELLSHLRESHLSDVNGTLNRLPITKEQEHQCEICSETFINQSRLVYHLRKHIGKVYGCEKCSKHFFTRYQVKKHMETHNKAKTVVICQICGKGFHYKSALHYHLKIHSNIRDLQCAYCPRRFYTTTSIKRHELTHTGARPYSCKYCDKKFRSLGETKKHQFLHTGERPHPCKYCSMGFTQKYNLKVHMCSHKGKFKCTHCGKGYADEDILRFHVRNKHEKKENEQATLEGESEEVQEHDVNTGDDNIDENNIDYDNNDEDNIDYDNIDDDNIDYENNDEDNIEYDNNDDDNTNYYDTNDDENFDDNIEYDEIDNDGTAIEGELLSNANIEYNLEYQYGEEVVEEVLDYSDQIFGKDYEIGDAVVVETIGDLE